MHPPQREQHPRDAAHRRQDHRLADHEPAHVLARRSQRHADRNVAPAGDRPREEQVGDVRARDQQHDDRRRAQSLVHVRQVPRWRLERSVVVLERLVAQAILGHEPRRQGVQVALEGLGRDSRPGANHRGRNSRSVEPLFHVAGHRQDHAVLGQVRRRHPDDRVGLIANGDVEIGERQPPPELRLPQVEPDDGSLVVGMVARTAAEEPAGERLHPEHVEVVRAHDHRVTIRHRVSDHDVARMEPPRGDRLVQSQVVAEREIHLLAMVIAVDPVPRRESPVELLRVLHRGHRVEHGIHDPVCRGREPDGERQRHDGHAGESGALEQRAIRRAVGQEAHPSPVAAVGERPRDCIG